METGTGAPQDEVVREDDARTGGPGGGAGDDGSGDGGDDGGVGGTDYDDATTVPWWHSPWRLLVLGAAVLFLGVAAGYAAFGGGSGRSAGSAVDVGFLQDMRAHHDQAVSMSFIYLEKPPDEQDLVLRSIAKTIIADQQFEAGYMVGLLLDMGAEPANQTGQAMAWMDEPVPLDRMPGMATEAQLDELQAATGPAADALFVDLMVAHHEGGIHMADHAAANAERADVRSLATRMATNQRGEIVDLRNALARAQA